MLLQLTEITEFKLMLKERGLSMHLSLATLPSLIYSTDHDISPSLGKKLVLELECWMSSFERVNRFPCGFGVCHICPFDENVPDPATELSFEDTFWSM